MGNMREKIGGYIAEMCFRGLQWIGRMIDIPLISFLALKKERLDRRIKEDRGHVLRTTTSAALLRSMQWFLVMPQKGYLKLKSPGAGNVWRRTDTDFENSTDLAA